MNLENVIKENLQGKEFVIDAKGNILTIDEIIKDLQNTKQGFEIPLSLSEIWEQEKPYYMTHGMNAFDCGYLGLKI